MKNSILFPLFLAICGIILTAGCMDFSGSPVTPAINQSDSSLARMSIPLTSLHQQIPDTNPNTVPIETAFNQTLAGFWGFTIDGPYATNPNWSSAMLDPKPVVLYDINGQPEYYEFYLRNINGTPGYFWTAANKFLGHGVFRIYEGPPSYNHTQIVENAEIIVKSRYPDYPVLLTQPSLYGGSYPHLSTRFMILNRTSGADERIIVDAFTHEIVPDHRSEDFKGHEYAWSYLDSIPQDEQPALIAQWELQNSNASRVVEYALAHGIDPRLPLSEQNTSIIREYYREQSPDSASAPDDTREKPDDRPLTDEIINKNIVSENTARNQATVILWRILIDRPDRHAGRSWRNASLSTKEPLIIEDISGNKLYYVFSVERSGTPISEIIVTANKGLYAHRFGLETPAGEYDFLNATRIARDIAAQGFPGYSLRTIRPVYSTGVSCCHNVSVIADVEDPETKEINRILVDTYTLDDSIEKMSGETGTNAYPSVFSSMNRDEYADNIRLWEKEDARVRNITGFAATAGIMRDLPLSKDAIITLGTYIFTTEARYNRQNDLYNPVYPQPAVRPTLDKATQVWHEQADWFSAILVDASLGNSEIGQMIESHHLPGNYTVDILSSGAMGADYYLDVPESDYNRTFSILEKDTSVEIREQVAPMWEYEQIVKRRNGSVIIPIAITYPEEANAIRLVAAGVPLKPMKEVYIQYDYTKQLKKAGREKILAELNADERILFAFKEYSS